MRAMTMMAARKWKRRMATIGTFANSTNATRGKQAVLCHHEACGGSAAATTTNIRGGGMQEEVMDEVVVVVAGVVAVAVVVATKETWTVGGVEALLRVRRRMMISRLTSRPWNVLLPALSLVRSWAARRRLRASW
jgi:hypothetical protein